MQMADVKRQKRAADMLNLKSEQHQSSRQNQETAAKSASMSKHDMEKNELLVENEKLQAQIEQMEGRSKVMSNGSYRGMEVMDMLDGESYLRSEVM